jgi:hypothetical protein
LGLFVAFVARGIREIRPRVLCITEYSVLQSTLDVKRDSVQTNFSPQLAPLSDFATGESALVPTSEDCLSGGYELDCDRLRAASHGRSSGPK